MFNRRAMIALLLASVSILSATLVMPVFAGTPPTTPAGVEVYKFWDALIVEKLYEDDQYQTIVQFQVYYKGKLAGERWLLILKTSQHISSAVATGVSRKQNGKIYKVAEISISPNDAKTDVYEGNTLTQEHVQRANALWNEHAKALSFDQLAEYYLKNLDKVPEHAP
jgi:hypothetical protein